jgi:hypothetical protein
MPATKSFLIGDPILLGGLATPRFFNGRLLSSEVLTQARDAERSQRERLGLAVGAGVVDGLWVDAGEGATLKVSRGSCLDRRGQTLHLPQDILLSFGKRGADGFVRENGAFDDCNAPSGAGKWVEGAYLLIVGPASGTSGRAPVSSLAGTDMCCNVRDDVEGVKFRLAPVIAPDSLTITADNRRSRVAHLCFGTRPGAVDDPGVDPLPTCLADADRLSSEEVPLAAFHWTGSAFSFIDVWAARRRVTAPAEDRPTDWYAVVGERHAAVREAMFLQFQAQLRGLPPGLPAAKHLTWLPPAGVLTRADPKTLETTWKTFLGAMAPADVRPVAGPQELRAVLRRGLLDDPIEVSASDPVPVDVYVHDRTAVFVRSPRGRLHVMVPELPAQPDERPPVEPPSRFAGIFARNLAPPRRVPGSELDFMPHILGVEAMKPADRPAIIKDLKKRDYDLHTFDLDPGTYTLSDLPLPRIDDWVATSIEVVGGKIVSHVLKKKA